ncbi:MAG: HAMP domain-containing histidine kinase, partial [Planctomycetaceae bacterium]|nr:HAMP domain-containing histidine kinase [Planctomycetaceae bacterium]
LIDDLLQFTAASTPRFERVRVRQVIDQVLAASAPQMISQGIVAAVDVPAGQTLLADREMFGRSIANLVRNALDAMPTGGELVFTSYDGPGGFELEVADSGPGLDPETRRHLFEPFYSTKPESAGLGLAVVAQIVAAHGGQVTVQNCPEGGAAFTLRFPRQALEAAA